MRIYYTLNHQKIWLEKNELKLTTVCIHTNTEHRTDWTDWNQWDSIQTNCCWFGPRWIIHIHWTVSMPKNSVYKMPLCACIIGICLVVVGIKIFVFIQFIQLQWDPIKLNGIMETSLKDWSENGNISTQQNKTNRFVWLWHLFSASFEFWWIKSTSRLNTQK